MSKFIFAYHGGQKPETEAEGAAVMARWHAWFEAMGEAVIDRGNPVGLSTTVSEAGVVNDGGANPLSGFSIIEADDLETAIALAKNCPIIGSGSVEIAETMQM